MRDFSTIVYATVVLIVGTYLYRQGWLLLRQRRKALLLGDRLALWVLQMLHGVEAARKKEAEITTPEKLKQSGFVVLATGMVAIIAGLLILFGVILKSIEVYLLLR